MTWEVTCLLDGTKNKGSESPSGSRHQCWDPSSCESLLSTVVGEPRRQLCPCSSSCLQVNRPLLEHKPTVWLFLEAGNIIHVELERTVYLKIGGCREEGLRNKLGDQGNSPVVEHMPSMSKVLASIPSTMGRKEKWSVVLSKVGSSHKIPSFLMFWQLKYKSNQATESLQRVTIKPFYIGA